ncbi:MAG: tetratricopeptide repeat protein [Candidatus Methanofastidiosia archaeon]|jgi:tetratricopeptide (TPR) repeat protein
MKSIEVLRKLFTEQELKENLRKTNNRLLEELDEKSYWMAACFSFDLARIYDLLYERKKSKHYYHTTLKYLDCADFQSLWMRIECLLAVGKSKKAYNTILTNPPHSQKDLARYYEKLGKYEISQKLYAELAETQSCDINKMENFIFPQCLQYISNLWEKAQNIEKAHEYNQRAVKAWEKITIEKRLYPIEEAWLYEGIGYIYEKSCEFGKALEYYEKSLKKYELADTKEYRNSSEANYIDGDWDYYYIKFFYFQLPEEPMLNLRVEDFMKFNFRRIKYRILKLEEKMQ